MPLRCSLACSTLWTDDSEPYRLVAARHVQRSPRPGDPPTLSGPKPPSTMRRHHAPIARAHAATSFSDRSVTAYARTNRTNASAVCTPRARTSAPLSRAPCSRSFGS